MIYKQIYRQIFSSDVDWNKKSVILLALLAVLPNLLGMINIQTPFGFKLHLFQIMIFLAAAVYGPLGGLVSGGFGSLFTAVSMNNPYILVGNMLLGFFAGWFMRKGISIVLSVLMAYSIQLPWLILTDIYLAGMPARAVYMIAAGLLVANLVWAVAAKHTYKTLRRMVA